MQQKESWKRVILQSPRKGMSQATATISNNKPEIIQPKLHQQQQQQQQLGVKFSQTYHSRCSMPSIFQKAPALEQLNDVITTPTHPPSLKKIISKRRSQPVLNPDDIINSVQPQIEMLNNPNTNENNGMVRTRSALFVDEEEDDDTQNSFIVSPRAKDERISNVPFCVC